MTNMKEKIIKLPSSESASNFQSQDTDALMDSVISLIEDNKLKAHYRHVTAAPQTSLIFFLLQSI